MDAAKRKELSKAYQNKSVTGGVYAIECSGNHRRWLKSSLDLEGSKNRFQFSSMTKSAPEPSMRQEWTTYGTDSFSFIVLEELTKGETQTADEFAADVQALYEMWLEKAAQEENE